MAQQQKQQVQWFPGHMAKTRRKIREMLPLVDAVTVILDARIPESSQNPEIADLIGKKPVLYLLNKCDLADAAITERWIAYWKKQGKTSLAVDCRSGKGLHQFRPAIRALCKERIRINEEKGMAGKALRVMVVGIPNTGKSSLPGIYGKNCWSFPGKWEYGADRFLLPGPAGRKTGVICGKR